MLHTLEALENSTEDFVLPPPDVHAEITGIVMTQQFLVSVPDLC